MAIKHRLSKLEKVIKPVERTIVHVTDMVTIPDGLTRAEQEAFEKNYLRKCRERREDNGTDGKTVVRYTLFFVPMPVDAPHRRQAET